MFPARLRQIRVDGNNPQGSGITPQVSKITHVEPMGIHVGVFGKYFERIVVMFSVFGKYLERIVVIFMLVLMNLGSSL